MLKLLTIFSQFIFVIILSSAQDYLRNRSLGKSSYSAHHFVSSFA
jgi:hypothetical protein